MKKLIASIKFGDSSLVIDDTTSTISFGALDRGNISDLTNWGCFSNTGDIEFFDADNQFKSIIASYPNAKVEISYLSRNTTKLLATFFIDDYDYNDETKSVKVKLKDALMDWQRRNTDEYYEINAQSIAEIRTEYLGEATRVTNEANTKMAYSSIRPAYLEMATPWSNASKICQASMLRCFCDNDGTPLFSDETPKQNNNIAIRPRNILSIENKIPRSKTRITLPAISEKQFTLHYDEAIAPEVPFTWYYIQGAKKVGGENHIVADWANYQVNCFTQRELGADGYGWCGASVSTHIKKPDHLYSFGNADIKVSFVGLSDGNPPNLVRSTMQTTDHSYSPNELTLENKGDSIKVFLKDLTVIDHYGSVEVETDGETEVLQNLVGTFCIEGGSIAVLGAFFTDDGEKTVGSKDELAITLQGNELINNHSIRYEDNDLGKPVFLAQHIIDTVEEKYSNGVECVVMEVTPSEYYDVDNNTIINPTSTKPLFEKYDIVTPYVMRNGFEQPYSTNDDGTPKSFKVMGIEYNYSGFLRQKLHLQENID